jgi:hypothetical protein
VQILFLAADSKETTHTILNELMEIQIENHMTELNILLNLFIASPNRETRLAHYYEINTMLSAFQAGSGRFHGIEPVGIELEASRDFMYSWFLHDYYAAFNQVLQSADVSAGSLTQGQATQFIDGLRELVQAIENEGILTHSDKETISERINMLFSDIVNAVDRQPPLVSWTRRNTGMVLIEGDAQFVSRIDGAMAIIREHPDYYEMVTTYVDIIRAGEYWSEASYMNVWENDPTAGIGSRVISGSLIFIAGVIVHEAYHSKLFWEYINMNNGNLPDPNIWAEGIGHMKVYEVERDFLIEAGAPIEILENVERRATNAWNRYPELRGMERPWRFRIDSDEPPRRELTLLP